jgi:hypothetical protein
VDRELEIGAIASAGGLLASRATHTARIGSPCANCGTALEGPYCHSCGQLAEDFERSLGSLMMETVENLFHADGRLFRTLPRLVLRPAALTRDYIAGKRASQMPPLRLFLVVILVFFLSGNLREILDPSRDALIQPSQPGAHLPASTAFNLEGPPLARAFGAWFKPRAIYASTHRREVAMALDSWLHRIAILFLPISTLILGGLFIFKRRFFLFDHAIFSMHSLSFMGMLFTGVTLVNLIPGIGGVGSLLAFAAPAHLLIHLRGFYGASILGALLRMFLLFWLSLLAISILFVGVLLLELNGMGGA